MNGQPIFPAYLEDTIQYHWNKNAVPIGAITGDMYNNMNTFDMANPYYFRQLNQEWGN